MKWNELSPVSWTIAEEEKLIKLMLKRSSTIMFLFQGKEEQEYEQ